MADIFVSYSKEDRDWVKQLVGVIEAQGWSVFWDRDIPIGMTWRSHVGQALLEARCVVVVWSRAAAESSWVQEEAEEGKAKNILIPVLIEGGHPPIGFRSIQAADLSDWDGIEPTANLQNVLTNIERVLGPGAAASAPHGAASGAASDVPLVSAPAAPARPVPAPIEQPPAAPPKSIAWRDGTSISNALKALLYVDIAFNVFVILVLLVGWGNGDQALYDNLTLVAEDPILLTMSIYALPLAVVFLIWKYRSYANLHAAQIEGLEFSPAWSIGWYFVPVANLWMPFRAMQGLYRASVQGNDKIGYKKLGAIGLWWICFWANFLLLILSAVLLDEPETWERVRSGAAVAIIAYSVAIAASIALIIVVSKITAAQRTLRERLRGAHQPGTRPLR
jgi:hypothetical protein